MEQEGREEPGTLLWCPECVAVTEVFYRFGAMGRSGGLGIECFVCQWMMFCCVVGLGRSWARDSCTWRWCWAELREVAAPLQGQRRMGPFSLHRAWGVFSTPLLLIRNVLGHTKLHQGLQKYRRTHGLKFEKVT